MASRTVQCPEGHKLPHREGTMECTPLYCGGEKPKLKRAPNKSPKAERMREVRKKGGAKSKAEKAREEIEEKAPEVLAETAAAPVQIEKAEKREPLTVPGVAEEHQKLATEELDKQTEAMVRARVRHATRQSVLDVPRNLKGAEAEQWADAKAAELLPLAMGELEFQLKFGDDKQRAEAAKEVRDMTGRGKREGGSNIGATIVLVGEGGGAFKVPWLPDHKQPGVQKRHEKGTTDAAVISDEAQGVLPRPPVGPGGEGTPAGGGAGGVHDSGPTGAPEPVLPVRGT